MKHKEFVYGGRLNARFEGTIHIWVRFSGVQEVRWVGTSRRVHTFLWKDERSPLIGYRDKRTLARPRRRRIDSINMNLLEIEFGGVGWIGLVEGFC
jgi:hypothetical protein